VLASQQKLTLSAYSKNGFSIVPITGDMEKNWEDSVIFVILRPIREAEACASKEKSRTFVRPSLWGWVCACAQKYRERGKAYADTTIAIVPIVGDKGWRDYVLCKRTIIHIPNVCAVGMPLFVI